MGHFVFVRMQASRRALNTVTPRWHSWFHKSDQWKTNCACSNHGILWVTDTVFCMTQRWVGARSEAMQIFGKVKKFDITLGDLWRTSMFMAQGFLIFHLGMVVGRGDISGYYHGPPIHEVWEEQKGHH